VVGSFADIGGRKSAVPSLMRLPTSKRYVS
jgi:hypothetical protein